jgi:chromosome segregation ATPase
MFMKHSSLGLFAAPDADGGAGGTGGQPAPNQPKPEETVEHWQSRFFGLQGAHQKTVEELKTKAAEWENNFKTLNTKLTDTTGRYETLSLEHKSVQENLAKATQDLTNVNARLQRLDMIGKEFPELIQMEVNGLLPAGSGDELSGKLKLLRDALKQQGSANAAALLNGKTPAADDKPAPTTKEGLRVQAMAAYNKGNLAEYDRIMDEVAKLP